MIKFQVLDKSILWEPRFISDAMEWTIILSSEPFVLGQTLDPLL